MGSRRIAWVFLLAVVIVAAAIVGLTTLQGQQEKVTVLCGGSMRAALEDIIARYSENSTDKVQATYGGSGELTAQIQHTGRGDVFICHDPFMPWAQEQGLIDDWTTVGYLDPVIVVPKENAKNITGLQDLAREGIRLGVGDQTYSSSGQIVKNLLTNLEYGDAVRENIRMETKGHQQRCTDVAMGSLDVAIVWNAVAHQFRDELQTIPIPKEKIDAITSPTYGESDLRNVKVTVGIISTSDNRGAARRFYEFATQDCKDIWENHGFRMVE